MESEFNLLGALVKTIDSFPPRKNLPVIDFRRKNDVHTAMYAALLDHSIHDDHQLALKVLGSKYSPEGYKVERTQFKQKLLNMLLHLDHSEKSISGQTKYRNLRASAQARVLSMNGLPSLAAQLAERELEDAKEFEETSNEIELLRILRNHASQNGRIKDIETYSKRLEILGRVLSNELRFEYLYHTIAIQFNRYAVPPQEVSAEIDNVLSEMTRLLNETPRFKMGHDYHKIRVVAFRAGNLNREAAIACDNALEYLGSNEMFRSPSRIAGFLYAKAEALVHSMNLNEASSVLDEAEKYITPTNTNWLSVMSYRFLIAMHLGQYQKADEILRRVDSDPRLVTLPMIKRERWKLKALYLAYAQTLGSEPGEMKPIYERVRRFRRDSKEIKRDKSGYYFALLLLETLLQFEMSDLGRLERSIEALKKFTNRHLKDEPDSQVISGFILVSANALVRGAKRREIESGANEARSDLDRIGNMHGVQILPYDFIISRIAYCLKQI